MTRAMVALLLRLQIIIQATAFRVGAACSIRAGPEKMMVVAAPTPYFTWEQCNDLVNAGKGYLTESINETKHAGVVTTL